MNDVTHNLSDNLWNGIADLVRRSKGTTEVNFVIVTKNDPANKLIYADEFGGLAIPLVSHSFSFTYYDTQADGSVQRRQSVDNASIICPSVGDLVIVIDVNGVKRFPICIGTIQSPQLFWEGA